MNHIGRPFPYRRRLISWQRLPVWIRRLLLWVTILLILGLMAGTAWIWQQHNRPVTLPLPLGQFPVGRVAYDWTDPTRVETLASEPGQKRELTVWIWYPAAPAVNKTAAPYLPASWVQARQAMLGVGAFLTQNLSVVQSHALADAPLATSGSPYPVLVMQPGLGPLVTDYTTLAEALASQGYVVVGSNPTFSANVVVFADGRRVLGTAAGNIPDTASPEEARPLLNRLITVWAADDKFILNQLEGLNRSDPTGRFTGRLNLQAVGIFGHSFGGAAAAQLCQLDSRCKAGADLDGFPYGTVVEEGLRQPFMFVWSEPPDATDPGWQQALQDTENMAVKRPHDQYEMTIQGMRHFNFSDQAIFFSPVLRLLGGLGPIDGRRGLEITVTYVQGFFDHYLKGMDVPLLNGPSPAYPEVQFKTQ